MSLLQSSHYQHILLKRILLKHSKREECSPLHKAAYGVYHNNYIENGIRALSISFPSVLGLLGEEAFRGLARLYLLQEPKQCFDWADYGEQFSLFMFEIDELSDMPFLPEIAELDWRILHIERAKDVDFNANSFSLLETEEPSQLRFILAPGIQIMQAMFPLKELYALVHDKQLRENEASKNAHLQITNKLIDEAITQAKNQSIILWREHYKARFDYCEFSSESAFNTMLRSGSVEEVLSCFEGNEQLMTNWLEQHIGSRKIYGLTKHYEVE